MQTTFRPSTFTPSPQFSGKPMRRTTAAAVLLGSFLAGGWAMNSIKTSQDQDRVELISNLNSNCWSGEEDTIDCKRAILKVIRALNYSVAQDAAGRHFRTSINPKELDEEVARERDAVLYEATKEKLEGLPDKVAVDVDCMQPVGGTCG